MPFGLKNALATFQRAMHGALAGQEDYSCSYIDDIIIFSDTWKENLAYITTVLNTLKHQGLKARPSKCQWGACKYVG